MNREDLPCVEKLLKTTHRVIKQENAVKRESTEQRIILWNDIQEKYNKYLDGECGAFLQQLDNCFHGDFNEALLILSISFTDNGESFAPAQRFSDKEREAYKKIIPYNIFESLTTLGIRKKLELQNDETLARWYYDYMGMKEWVNTTLKDPGMDEHVRYFLNNKWSVYCRNADKALNESPRIPPKDLKPPPGLIERLMELQEKSKKLTRYGPLTKGPLADVQNQITAKKYDDAPKTLKNAEDTIDTLMDCESLLAAWKAKGYTLTELEGLLPRNADEVRPAFHKTEQNINRLETITQEIDFKKSNYPNFREQPETASILLSIEQNLKNPARIDTVEKDYQQLNNAIGQQGIIEQKIRDQLEKVRREVSSSEIKQEIDLIEKSIKQRDIPRAKEILMNLAKRQLSKVNSALSALRTEGKVNALSSDQIRGHIAAQRYDDAIIDSETVIAKINQIRTDEQKKFEQKILAEKQLSEVTAVLSKFRLDSAAVSDTTDPIRKQINAQNYGDAIIDSEKVIAEWNSIEGSRFVKVVEAKQYEMNFIGRTGRKVGKVKNQIEIGGRIFIVEEITEVSKCFIDDYISQIKRQLTPNEKQNLPENRHLTAKLVEKKFLDLGAKERYTFRAFFLSRPEKYAKFGFDTKPLAMTDINPVLDDALKEAKQIGETVFLCIASPTGFEPDLRTFTDGDAFHKRFISHDLSVCFIDLETATILVNPHDKVAASFRPLCEMESYSEKTEKVKRILYPLVDDQLLYPGNAQYPDVLEKCRKESGVTEEGIIKKVFLQYGTEKELPVRFIKDVGLVIMK